MNQKEFIQVVGSMPPLPHSVPGLAFDINRSEAVQWIMAQPGFKDWVWARMRSTGRLAWDEGAQRWHGIAKGKPGRPLGAVQVAEPVVDAGAQIEKAIAEMELG